MSEDTSKESLYNWTQQLCLAAGENYEFFLKFVKGLDESPEIMEEFRYYYEHQDFLCKKKVNGYSIVDLMVWNIDKFKSELDRGNDTKNNPERMILLAFDAMLCMEKEPENYTNRLLSDTGTDYVGKYS